MKGTGEFGEKMNTMTKYVVSSTLDKLEWPGSKLVRGNLAEEMRRLKREPGHDLLLSGSAQLFNALMRENLIDIYRFMVHPVILGKGKRLFAGANDKRALELVETRRFSLGIVIMEYKPAKNP
jgi:dihydrofolate reductase